MKFDRLIVLLPSHSIENFDLERKEADAEQLLSAWSALWHPLLLANARTIPGWLPAGSPPSDPVGHLIIVPDCCEPMLPEDWLVTAETAGGCVLRNLPDRDAMLAAALAQLDADQPKVDPELTADFLALGFCHLQIELLTRKLRYMSNLDEASLQTALLAATDAAVAGDVDGAKLHLQSAFDRLHEARDYFYQTNARLLDLTLVASTTLGESLRAELAGGLPRNLLVSAEVIDEAAQREPRTLDAIRRALADNQAALVGGEFTEVALPLLEPEAIDLHLRRGLAVYDRHLQQHPAVFGRRRFGLTPVLPQILARRGFTGAFHCTLDDGRFPTGNQSRIQWEGLDGTTIEAIGCLPIDATRAESFLRLAERLNDAMNLDDAATVVFAHWPGRTCRWYDDLRRIATYGTVLGTFVTITDYFSQTAYSGQRNHHKADEYRSPYLNQDVTASRRDPISRWVRYFGRRASLEALQTLSMLATVCGGGGKKGEGRREKGEKGENEEQGVQLAMAVEAALNADDADTRPQQDAQPGATNGRGFVIELEKPLADFARTITGAAASAERGCLVVNPWSFSQEAYIASSSHAQLLSVDVPAMGFAWIDPNTPALPPPVERKGWFGRGKPQEPPPLAEENVLRNEFFEAKFDPNTGAIRSIHSYHVRDPLLAQQIALRLPHGGEPGDEINYSVMAADELVVTSSGPVLGEMQSRGRLLDREGRRLAGFRQTTRARRGSRVIEIEIELDVDRQPGPNPWDSYYAARFAWKDETAVLYRSMNMANVPTDLSQIESPHFLDLRRDKQRTTLLCGGLPYHRRFGLRKLDTLLVVHGERARTFRLGIGIDVPHPMSAALGFIAPPLVLPDQPRPPSPTGWLFHLDCRNVLATHWAPLEDAAGFRVRLLETDGRGVRVGLRCFRAVGSAQKLNHGDVPPVALTTEGDRVDISIGPHQWLEAEVRFAG